MDMPMLIYRNLVQAQSQCFLNYAFKLGDFVALSRLFLTGFEPGLLGQLLLSKLEPERTGLGDVIHLVIKIGYALEAPPLVLLERKLTFSGSWGIQR